MCLWYSQRPILHLRERAFREKHFILYTKCCVSKHIHNIFLLCHYLKRSLLPFCVCRVCDVFNWTLCISFRLFRCFLIALIVINNHMRCESLLLQSMALRVQCTHYTALLHAKCVWAFESLCRWTRRMKYCPLFDCETGKHTTNVWKEHKPNANNNNNNKRRHLRNKKSDQQPNNIQFVYDITWMVVLANAQWRNNKKCFGTFDRVIEINALAENYATLWRRRFALNINQHRVFRRRNRKPMSQSTKDVVEIFEKICISIYDNGYFALIFSFFASLVFVSL